MSSLAQPLRPSIERLRRQWRASPMPGFFAWWGAELRACVPVRWRHVFGAGRVWRLLRLEGDSLVVRRADDDAPLARIDTTLAPELQQAAIREAVADIDPADLYLALSLPEADVLRRRLVLPAAALDDLHQVLGFEMDRQTPFPANSVYYDARELGAAGEGVSVELVAAPRARIDPMLQQLARCGVEVDAVDVDVGGKRLGVNLLPGEQRRRRVDRRQRMNLVLALGALLLLVLCMGQWLGNRRAALAAMQQRVDAMQGEARQVAALRKRLLDNLGAAGFLARRKAQSPGVLAVLDDLSTRFPDGTWLERLNIDDEGRVGLQGQSPQAARLVDMMKGSPLLTEPSFQGVIQTDPKTGKERFYLVAQMRTPKTPATTREAGHAPEAD